MTRYAKQRDSYSCGPTALLNALKWAGKDVSCKDMPRLKAVCHTEYTPGHTLGTWPTKMSSALRYEGREWFSCKHVINPKLRIIDKHLKDDGSIIMSYFWKLSPEYKRFWDWGWKYVGHYIFIDHISASGKTFRVINMSSEGSAQTNIRRHTLLRKCFRYRNLKDNHHNLSVWLLNKWA